MKYKWKIKIEESYHWPTAFQNAVVNLTNHEVASDDLKSYEERWNKIYPESQYSHNFSYYTITFDSYEDYIAFQLKWS